ncbi:UDP-glucosyltransferase 2-like [Bombus fervidus]|uniref:UDP-glucosyltransferase 2-like n=1 Tax=Bombus fervidus TaxID=203811 RepID=UPI003AB3841B
MKHQKALFCVLLALSIHANNASRILGIFPYNGKSHFLMFDVLCKELAKRGHQVDVISHFPSKTQLANYTDIIDLNGTLRTMVNNMSTDYGKRIQQSITYNVATAFGNNLCNLMKQEKMQKFIKNPPNDPPYDLIMVEYFGSPCYIGFGQLLNAPVAIVLSSMQMAFVDDFMGNPTSYAFLSGFNNDNAVVNTFFDRLWNFFINYKHTWIFQHYTAEQTNMMKQYLGLPNIPDIRELEKTVSLAIVNSHYSYYGIRPVTPAVIEVGGLHIEADKSKLSPKLKEWLDMASHGVVYFSLGSLMNIETLPTETILQIYTSFAKLSPIKVLLKSANATKLPSGLPNNVLTLPWIPQVAVLKHPNIRVFVTHGGLMGTQEATYYGVPMIGIPVFADQIKNINILVEKNVAVLIDIDDITEHTMDVALNTVLYDPRYRESAKTMSKMFRDRPMTALDTAVYWIEYVLRNGPDSLRSAAVNLPWWKLHLLDVFVFLFACFTFAIYLLIVLLNVVLTSLQRKAVRTEKKLN